MTYSVVTDGVERAAALLGAYEKEVVGAQQSAINDAAAEFRQDFIDEIHAGTGLKKSLIRSRIRLTRARRNLLEARLVPDSKGLPITDYAWHGESAGHPTRARILIRWFGGLKVSAGFINPASERPLPLKTITSKGRHKRPILAHGISVAAAFKTVRDDGRLERYTWRLAEIFEEKLAEQLSRRS